MSETPEEAGATLCQVARRVLAAIEAQRASAPGYSVWGASTVVELRSAIEDLETWLDNLNPGGELRRAALGQDGQP